MVTIIAAIIGIDDMYLSLPCDAQNNKMQKSATDHITIRIITPVPKYTIFVR
jgi:hypothetical protein